MQKQIEIKTIEVNPELIILKLQALINFYGGQDNGTEFTTAPNTRDF